ncbi:MAG: hypothetical protein A2X82_00520 [Geobacteraceae bacterium GWC2_55_20]|nr:MAG: hypothetical protein A2X82_00520 [Geobacteraceae bacterium GWC2_55_20]HCE68901.1 hypothetical protein [Geobacter sp.]
MKKTLLALFFVFATSVMAMSADTLPKPDVLNEENVSMTKGFSSYDTIIINNLDMDHAEYSRVDEEEKNKIESMKPMMNTIFTSTIETELKKRKLFKNIKINAKPEGNELIYNAAVDEFNAGSRALTMFVGFGSGKVHVVMTGKFIDAQTGKELASFKDQEAGGFFGSQDLSGFEGKFPAFVGRIATLSTDFIEKLYK